MSNTILIATIDKSVSRHFAEIVKNAGYTSHFVYELSNAAEAFSKSNPELIIADTEFSEWYLSQSKDERLMAMPPLICYIKDYNARLAYDFLKKGAYDCINDPLRPVEIMEVVSKALSRDVLSFEKLARQTIFDYVRDLPAQFKLLGGAGLFLFLLLFFILLFRGPPARSFFAVPHQDVTGIVVRPKTVFLSNWFTQAIYRYKRDTGELIDVYYFSDYGPLGMASDGIALWTIGTDQKVRKYLLDDTARQLEQMAEISLPIASPGGIFIESHRIWFSDIHRNKLHVYEIIQEQIRGSGVSLRTVAEYSTGNISPVGILKVGDERIFVIDRISGSLFSGVISERKFIVQREHMLKSADQKLAALSTEGPHLFTVSKGDRTLVKKHHIGKLK